ncbi:hypothetical protein EBB07_01215 [Paenibacillaceae bacterium]|nr:hypothetical protein EBB07_01215 [Paenibacillaceae bacterium]
MKTGKVRHTVYLVLALAMLALAINRFEFGQGTLSVVAGIVWILFALLFITAQLYTLFVVNEQTKQQMLRIKRAKALIMQRKIEQRLRRARS